MMRLTAPSRAKTLRTYLLALALVVVSLPSGARQTLAAPVTLTSLLEAARVDGLSWFGIYGRIVPPLSTSVIISASLVLFLSQWESFFWPLLVANSPEYQVVQVALSNFQTQYLTRWDDLFAGSVVTTAIPTVILLVLQRYFVHTIAGTGLKE